MSEKISQILNHCPRLELYQDNGFRRLGLRVPADSRAVMRRLDELRVSLELGRQIGGWSFAPSGPHSADGLRESTRHLQEPLRRLLDEFFWFWPATYPESGDDVAMDAFMAGDSAAATAAWSAAAGRGEAYAWHNLAVYQHLLALEWLDSPEVDNDTRRSLWTDAVNYWKHVVANDGIWRAVTARIKSINDPRLPEATGSTLRAELPAILARIHALAAVRLAGMREAERVAFQLECMSLVQSGCDVGGELSSLVQPIAKRLSVQLSEARRVSTAQLSGIESLWTAVCEDLTTLQMLGAPLLGLCGDQQRLLMDVLLDRLEAAQTAGAAPAEALVHYLLALDLVATGQGGGRAEKLFSATLGRALAGATDGLGEAEQIRRLMDEVIVPGLKRLTLTPQCQASAYARLAAWMQMLGETAVSGSPAMLPWGLQIVRSASGLPLDGESRGALKSTVTGWAAEPRVMRRPAFELSVADHALRVDVVGITFGGRRIEATELTGICHTLPGFGGEGQPVIRWSDATQVVELPSTFLSTETALQSVLTAMYQLVLPHLFQRILSAVRGGVSVPIGPLKLHSGGIFTSDSSKPRPYASLRLASDSTGITLVDDSDQDFVLKLDPANDWNAPLLPLLLLSLTPR